MMSAGLPGDRFRPEYLALSQLKKSMPDVPIIALTATADRITQKDILEKLGLHSPVTYISSFNRANITYTVERKKGSFEKLIDFLKKHNEESGIIYCLSRAATETLAEQLRLKGFEALAYHAGLEREIRSSHQEQFIRDEVKIIVATIAFGRGSINLMSVRLHRDLPKTWRAISEPTRRTRWLPSEALLFYFHGDVGKMKRFVEVQGNAEQTKINQKKVEQIGAYGEIRSCRRKYLLNYFDEPSPDQCSNCDVCLSGEQRIDMTEAGQKVLSAVSRLQERFGAVYIMTSF